MESPTSNRRETNLKAHKVLPRRRIISFENPTETKERRPRKRRASESHQSDISSWIEQASPTLSSASQRLPLTPPLNSEDKAKEVTEDPVVTEILDNDQRSIDNTTPVGQMSPLTPDLTPPRKIFSDTISHERYPSSAAESFRTAKEFATSEDTFQRFSSPESDLSTVIQDTTTQPSVLLPNGNTPLSHYARNIGLGLGLDLTSDTEASVVLTTPERYDQSPLYSRTMDENSSHSSPAEVVEDPILAKTTAAVQQVERDNRNQQIFLPTDEQEPEVMSQKRFDSFSNTRDGSLLLKHRIVSDRLESHRKSLIESPVDDEPSRNSTDLKSLLPNGLDKSVEPESSDIQELPLLIQVDTETSIQVEERQSPAMESKNAALELQQPVTSIEITTPARRHRTESPEASTIRRLSRVSANSNNVIEAMVITPPRQKRHKLRRSSKNHCLRDSSSPQTNNSNRSSLNSNHQAYTLRHKLATLPDKINRVSLNSDSGISMSGDQLNPTDNLLPLDEIPQRRSSLKGRRKPVLTLPQKEKRSSRPVTAPERLMSPTGEIMSQMHPIFDTRSHSLKRSSEARGREVRLAPAVIIPPRSSSLSAPTSRNNSRTVSLTSDVRKSQDHLQNGTPQRNPHRSSSPHVRISLPDQEDVTAAKDMDSPVDPFLLDQENSSPMASPYLRSSLTRTPFSAISTPGPVEFGQGTTVSLYPHHNESLLLVQHSNRPESQGKSLDMEAKPILEPAPEIRQRRHVSTPTSKKVEEIPSSQEMRRNISATSTSYSVALSSPSRHGNSRQPFNIARTPSARRHSDSFVMPLSKLAAVSKSTPPRQRIKTNDPSNSLAPFWRPNGFWNDLSDDEDDSEDSDAEDIPQSNTFVVRNTLGLPQQPVIAGSSGLARRLGSLRRRKQMQNLNGATDRSTSMPSLQDGISVITNGFHHTTTTKKRRSISLTPIINIYDTFHQKREERMEAQQEKRRQKLKKSIGPAVLRDTSTR